MLTGCFVHGPLRGFDSWAFEHDRTEGDDAGSGGLICENLIFGKEVF